MNITVIGRGDVGGGLADRCEKAGLGAYFLPPVREAGRALSPPGYSPLPSLTPTISIPER